MSEPFLSEIKIFGFNWPPRNWAQCDGQLLAINQNQSLFALVGTKFGGDGITNFALPDMRGRTPMHANDGKYNLGQKGGEEKVTLSEEEMPSHRHIVRANTDNADTNEFSGKALAAGFDSRSSVQKPANMYTPANNLVSLHAESVSNVNGQAHTNEQPSCVVNFCIALQGQFPTRD
ncbi:phage tail protein [Colwellia sp. RSH04]|uniref:phage tail protein n=1 Tax=Colwellia sp. RSH04 TaxID=2305464 RepID=UPI000E584DD9|nr:tail fiber protein [Colwellia sp. RSH04]RHW77997.1 phage tail protein [Colwellia sp. RSH04]